MVTFVNIVRLAQSSGEGYSGKTSVGELQKLLQSTL